MSVLLQIVYLLVFAFLYVLFGRMIMSVVMGFGRRWRPGRGAAAALEVVWSVTDPPLKALRRVIPPIRLGAVSFDLRRPCAARYCVRADVLPAPT